LPALHSMLPVYCPAKIQWVGASQEVHSLTLKAASSADAVLAVVVCSCVTLCIAVPCSRQLSCWLPAPTHAVAVAS
jgi:hypothetical protein